MFFKKFNKLFSKIGVVCLLCLFFVNFNSNLNALKLLSLDGTVYTVKINKSNFLNVSYSYCGENKQFDVVINNDLYEDFLENNDDIKNFYYNGGKSSFIDSSRDIFFKIVDLDQDDIEIAKEELAAFFSSFEAVLNKKDGLGDSLSSILEKRMAQVQLMKK